jgi:dipeptidyl aminopeptidase/acylaminoacyl peptidase
VLQPQFRGSTGFGQELKDAGEAEWGAGMQHDIDDGTRFLIDEGIADAERVCMLGWSYGGYAALWAGAFSPDMYRCIAAIAPVTDIPRLLRQANADMGQRHWVIDYWEALYGAEASDRDLLRQMSPAEHADAFEAPVLLVHGRKDTVVKSDQSKVMYKALRKAGKDVELVDIKGEDHWMSQAETRIEMLRAVAEFIEEHL